MDGTATEEISSYEVRQRLEQALEWDLLGPGDGPEEELVPGISPAERYLLGRLVPRRPTLWGRRRPATVTRPPDGEPLPLDEPELVDREVTSSGFDDDEDAEAEAVIRAGTMAASAMGLSFTVPSDVDVVSVTASWGRYERVKSEVHVTEHGNPRTVWKRRPSGGTVEVPLLVEARAETLIPDPRQERIQLRYTVRHRGACRVVDIALVNGEPEPPATPDVARIYQVRLQVTALDGASAVFVGHNDPELREAPSRSDPERLHLALLYRALRQYAHGRQCAVDADVRPPEKRAWRLTTTCFPSVDVPMVQPGDPKSMPGLVLDMARLGSPELARNDLVRALRPLVRGYRDWLDAQEKVLAQDPEVARYEPAGEQALKRARSLADRLDRAVELLRDDGIAREAFRFANQAMAQQRVRTELVRARLADPSADVGVLRRRLDVPAMRSWRPFQLAFVLLCLPGLTDPDHPDALRGMDDAEVQLLFFPTGGGKTEAYLGLTAYTFAIRRLQGVVGEGVDARDGTDGVAVLMRYTLRLLTAQQFQRAASLVCACETLRRERIASGDSRWGATPFRIGLWVGMSVTPNTYDDAKQQIATMRGNDRTLGGVLQLVACPWCGSALSASRDLRTDDNRRRVLLFCSDPEGDCHFTEKNSRDEGLPVLTVDEEIYRLTPALIISTVDKLAQLPWKAGTAPLFGLVDTRCARHGWRTPDTDGFCKSRHPAVTSAGLPAVQAEPALPLRPPDLIIQDELHLITDALGSMVGLYETVVDRLCRRRHHGRLIRPVLVASTATIRRAHDQVEQVFARDLAIFPPQVIDASETFFSTTAPPSAATPSRRYRGILATGERLKSIEIRVVSAVMEHAQYLFDRHGTAADPYMTVVDYFGSTRELAGMRRLVEDDIADRLSSLRVRTTRRRPVVAELTSRMPSSRITASLAELERSFDPSFDSTAALEGFRRDREGAREKLEGRAQPVDVLLATNMLQVGVDVQRLGLMVVTGQPKNTAEYIQATSRVGRDRQRPGLVLTIYQWSRPRDLAHYEDFAYDHATFGMRVEGLTTTPFSDRALDRGLTGVLATAVRHSSFSTLPNQAAHSVPLTGADVAGLLDDLATRAERVTHENDRADAVRREAQGRLDRWQQRRDRLDSGRLGYTEAPDIAGLLRKPDDGPWEVWSVPTSLREVEPDAILQLDAADVSLGEAPGWDYTEPTSGGGF